MHRPSNEAPHETRATAAAGAMLLLAAACTTLWTAIGKLKKDATCTGAGTGIQWTGHLAP